MLCFVIHKKIVCIFTYYLKISHTTPMLPNRTSKIILGKLISTTNYFVLYKIIRFSYYYNLIFVISSEYLFVMPSWQRYWEISSTPSLVYPSQNISHKNMAWPGYPSANKGGSSNCVVISC